MRISLQSFLTPAQASPRALCMQPIINPSLIPTTQLLPPPFLPHSWSDPLLTGGGLQRSAHTGRLEHSHQQPLVDTSGQRAQPIGRPSQRHVCSGVATATIPGVTCQPGGCSGPVQAQLATSRAHVGLQAAIGGRPVRAARHATAFCSSANGASGSR